MVEQGAFNAGGDQGPHHGRRVSGDREAGGSVAGRGPRDRAGVHEDGDTGRGTAGGRREGDPGAGRADRAGGRHRRCPRVGEDHGRGHGSRNRTEFSTSTTRGRTVGSSTSSPRWGGDGLSPPNVWWRVVITRSRRS